MRSINSAISEGESVSARSDTKQSPLSLSLASHDDDGLALGELKRADLGEKIGRRVG